MLSIPPRTTTLDPDDPGGSPPEPGRPWWAPIGPWPDDVHFEDVGPAVLDLEHMLDPGKLGPPPVPAGTYSCTAAWCTEAPLAELDELSGPPPRRATVLRRGHPLDRLSLRTTRGAA